jgi:Skp family chaperone for outer membrane proteins
MGVNHKQLTEERVKLKKDFDDLSAKIATVDKELTTMRNNLNAVYGALQQTDKLIKLSSTPAPDENEKQLLTEKDK